MNIVEETEAEEAKASRLFIACGDFDATSNQEGDVGVN